MRETLRFQTNVPEVVALAFPDGRKVEGRYGDQFMFTLDDDRVMYLDPPVAEKVRQLGVGKGEQFQVIKKETREGTRRSIEWIVEPVKAAEPTPPQAAKPEGGAVQAATSTSQPQSTANGNGAARVNGNGAGAHVPLPYVGTEAGGFLLSALVNSVDIWLAVRQYALAKGLELTVSSEDVRALAITAFINTRGGR